MPAERRVLAAYLDDATADLELATAGLRIQNRHAVFHIQQAAEKLVKAVRLHRDLLPTKEHRIAVLVEGAVAGEPLELAAGDPWRARLLPLDSLSEYATTYRYPTPSGRLKEPPADAKLDHWVGEIEDLLDQAREELLGT
jgi:HEPN domain-containing protein